MENDDNHPSFCNWNDDKNILDEIETLVDEEPRTIKELHEVVGEEAGMTRDQVEYRATQLADSGVFSSKKGPGRTSPRIFWSGSSEKDQ